MIGKRKDKEITQEMLDVIRMSTYELKKDIEVMRRAGETSRRASIIRDKINRGEMYGGARRW